MKCRKADSRSERSGSSGERRGGVGAAWGAGGLPKKRAPGACQVFPRKPAQLSLFMLFSLIFASTAQHANPVSRSFPPQVRV